MKKLIRVFTTTILLLSVIGAIEANAQNHKNHGENRDWKEKMMNEKIAFFTEKIGLTNAEAEAFWPIYNKIAKAKEEKMKRIHRAYAQLNRGLYPRPDKNGVTPAKVEGEKLEALLEEYIDALEDMQIDEDDAKEQYLKVLSVEKVAKMYLAEEMFRRQQIGKFKKGPIKPR